MLRAEHGHGGLRALDAREGADYNGEGRRALRCGVGEPLFEPRGRDALEPARSNACVVHQRPFRNGEHGKLSWESHNRGCGGSHSAHVVNGGFDHSERYEAKIVKGILFLYRYCKVVQSVTSLEFVSLTEKVSPGARRTCSTSRR